LHGHLSNNSINLRKVGDKIKKGDILGFIGNETENGNWPPHVHI